MRSRPGRTSRMLMRGVAAICVLLGSLGMTGVAATAAAQTTTQTDVTVLITDTGTLDVHWGDGPFQFLANGAAPSVTAVDAAQTTATFSIVIHDTRADSDRTGYAITLTSTGIGADGSAPLLGPEHLLISDLTGLPEGASAPNAIGSTLVAPVTVISVAANAPAIDTTISLAISLTIPAGTFPGTYTGGFSLDVLPGASVTAP